MGHFRSLEVAVSPIEGVELEDCASVEERPQSGSAAALGARMRDLRRRRGFTLEEVGKSLGVTRACVCQWECGRSYPQHKFLPGLARILATSVSFLMSGEESEVVVDDHAAAVIRKARKEIAEALHFDVARVRIEIDHLA